MEGNSNLYASGRVSVLSGKLLTGEKFLRMADSAALEDALKILMEAGYAEGMQVSDPMQFETLLEAEWKKTVDFVKESTPDKNSTDCFLLLADFRNAKILMKDKYQHKQEHAHLETWGISDANRMREKIFKDEYSEFPPEMAEALGSIDRMFYEGSRKPNVIDTALDKAYYKTALRLLKKAKSRAVKTYFVCEIDGQNLLSFFRVRKTGLAKETFDALFIPGGQISKETFDKLFSSSDDAVIEVFARGPWADVVKKAAAETREGSSLAGTELLCLNKKRDEIVPYKNESDTVLPLINYLLAKKTEIANARLLLVGIKNRIAKEKLIARLRELYV